MTHQITARGPEVTNIHNLCQLEHHLGQGPSLADTWKYYTRLSGRKRGLYDLQQHLRLHNTKGRLDIDTDAFRYSKPGEYMYYPCNKLNS